MDEYQFPVTDKFEAREVTEPDFEIEPDSPAYVNLDEFRGTSIRDEILFSLNIENGELARPTKKYVKIVFSGHKGSGKTLELKRLQSSLDAPERYFSVFIQIEREFELGKFQSEYLFIALITKLIAKLNEENIDFQSTALDDIAKDWISEKVVKEELKDRHGLEVKAEASVGITLFNFLNLGTGLKAITASESKTTENIKRMVRQEPMQLINRLNAVLSDIRNALTEQGKAKDILFIMDGSEKIQKEVNQRLFVDDAHLLKAINANMILSVPINSWFNIQSNPAKNFTSTFMLPMLRVNETSQNAFAQLVNKRIEEETFFENANVLLALVQYSGGNPQLLMRLVNTAIVKARGKAITDNIVKETLYEAGREMHELLTSEHMDCLESGNFHNSDPIVLELLLGLTILKYNGHREINPVLKKYILSTNPNFFTVST